MRKEIDLMKEKIENLEKNQLIKSVNSQDID